MVKNYGELFLLQGQRSLEKPLWREGAEVSHPVHLAVSYAEKIFPPLESLWFFFKGSASVQTSTADEDCPQCALLFSNNLLGKYDVTVLASQSVCRSRLAAPFVTWWYCVIFLASFPSAFRGIRLRNLDFLPSLWIPMVSPPLGQLIPLLRQLLVSCAELHPWFVDRLSSWRLHWVSDFT